MPDKTTRPQLKVSATIHCDFFRTSLKFERSYDVWELNSAAEVEALVLRDLRAAASGTFDLPPQPTLMCSHRLIQPLNGRAMADLAARHTAKPARDPTPFRVTGVLLEDDDRLYLGALYFVHPNPDYSGTYSTEKMSLRDLQVLATQQAYGGADAKAASFTVSISLPGPATADTSDSTPIQLTVRTLLGKNIPLKDVPRSSRIHEVKARVQDREGCPIDQQRLIFEGRQLEDDYTLKDYELTDGDVLHLVLRLRGGMFHTTSGRAGYEDLDDVICAAPKAEAGSGSTGVNTIRVLMPSGRSACIDFAPGSSTVRQLMRQVEVAVAAGTATVQELSASTDA